MAPARGDCEDFALTKKMRLRDAGVPSSALLVALAVTASGKQHAVLIVRTDHGDIVLDSLDTRMREWTPSLYRWTSVQSPTDEWVWYRVGSGMVAKAEPMFRPEEASLRMAIAVGVNAFRIMALVRKSLMVASLVGPEFLLARLDESPAPLVGG